MKKISLFLLVLVGMTACIKEEIPVQKPILSAATVQVEMGSNYGNQIFYNLLNQKIERINQREIWDLGFESALLGQHIVLNSSKLMNCAQTQETELSAVQSVDNLIFTYDSPSGNLDSTAFGEWWQTNRVYVINRGVSLTGTPLGYVKMKIIEMTNDAYTFEWANLIATESNITMITKNPNYNFTCFSFENGGQIMDIEPEKSEWQLCFTTYTHVYPDGTPYLVTGVLSNFITTKIAKTSLTYSEINGSTLTDLTFSEDKNIIGFDWKTYNFATSQYEVNSNISYILQIDGNRFFKIRFIDFYTEQGVKGAPQFELTEII